MWSRTMVSRCARSCSGVMVVLPSPPLFGVSATV
jgi:hypothetical protein